MFPTQTRLEPGQRVEYDPDEWIIDGDGMFKNDFVRAYHMVNKRAKVALGAVISARKEDHPESIDPFKDCCAMFQKPPLATRLHFALRVKDFKAPSKKEILDLERGAIATLLDSIGAWPPGRDNTKNKPRYQQLRELIQAAIAKLERANPPKESFVDGALQALRQFRTEHNSRTLPYDSEHIAMFQRLNASLDSTSSFDEIEQALKRFLSEAKERKAHLASITGSTGQRDQR
jgi:hypothetical protein